MYGGRSSLSLSWFWMKEGLCSGIYTYLCRFWNEKYSRFWNENTVDSGMKNTVDSGTKIQKILG
jgi:hypothetical protein